MNVHGTACIKIQVAVPPKLPFCKGRFAAGKPRLPDNGGKPVRGWREKPFTAPAPRRQPPCLLCRTCTRRRLSAKAGQSALLFAAFYSMYRTAPAAACQAEFWVRLQKFL